MEEEPRASFIRKKPLLLLAAVISVLLIAVGYLYYRDEEKTIRKEKHNELKAIAELKIGQITQWFKERKADASVMSKSPFFVSGMMQWLDYRNNLALKEDIIQRLIQVKEGFEYENIILASPEGEFLLSLNPEKNEFDPFTSAKIIEAVKKQQIIFTDFYRCSIDGKIHIDIIAPVVNKKKISVAALVFYLNPDDYLYPLIQSWPMPSETAETLIIRREGDSVLFLNELRHRKNTALQFRIPLSGRDIPAVQAVSGSEGIIEGKDYRGIDVLADIGPVPGTPWYMIAKVDKSEIFSKLYYRSIVIAGFTFLLIILIGAGTAWVYHYRQRDIYKELFLKEKDLREAQEEFRVTLYSIGDAVITTDTKGNIRHINPVAEQVTGWKEPDAQGKPLQEVFRIINEETRSKVENPVQRVLREGLVIGLSNHTLLISKDGKEIPIADSGAPIRNEKGDVIGVVLVFRDQTEERATQKMLRESEERFRTAGKAAYDLIYEWDVTSDTLEWFGDVDGLLGYRKGEISRDISAWLGLIHAEDRVRLENAVELHRTSTKPIQYEYRIRHKDGTYMYWIDHGLPLLDDKGRPYKWVGVCTDITERKRAEKEIQKLNIELEQRVEERTAQLQSANKELEAFAYSVSHDLRAPLRAIDGFTQILTRDYKTMPDDERKRVCSVITEGSKKMGQLIDDLLAFSRIGRAEMHFSSIDMKTLARAVFDELATPEMRRRIDFQLGDLKDASGDITLIRQVWTNLISNAIKFSSRREQAVISITSSEEEERVVYCIRDNGAGFDMKYADKLFGVFQRLHSTKEFEGTGVGLAIVQRIVLRHGRQVWAEGEVDKGAAFFFSLPRKEGG